MTNKLPCELGIGDARVGWNGGSERVDRLLDVERGGEVAGCALMARMVIAIAEEDAACGAARGRERRGEQCRVVVVRGWACALRS